MVKVSAFDSIDYLHPPKLCAEGTNFSNSPEQGGIAPNKDMCLNL